MVVTVVVVDLGTVYGWGMGSTQQLSQGDDEDDVFAPVIITGKQLQNKFVYFTLFPSVYCHVYIYCYYLHQRGTFSCRFVHLSLSESRITEKNCC